MWPGASWVDDEIGYEHSEPWPIIVSIEMSSGKFGVVQTGLPRQDEVELWRLGNESGLARARFFSCSACWLSL